MSAAWLRMGTPGDVPAIMATERLPGYEAFVGRSEAALHRAEMADPGRCFLVWERAGRLIGFANLRGLDDPTGNVLLRRIALAEPGQGQGRLFLAALQDWVFARPTAYRFWLDVYEDNLRARRAYRAAGFREEGLMREIYPRGEGRASAVLMAMLRPEWQRLRSG